MTANTATGLTEVDVAVVLAPHQPGILVRVLHDRIATLGLVAVVAFIVVAVCAPVLAPHDPNQTDVLNSFGGPSSRFPLGTDNLGRDELSRLLFGARLSIGAVVMASLAIGAIGLTMGMIAGYIGGVVDALISWIVDILLAFPTFLLALAVTGILGPSLRNVIIAVVAVWWAGYARIVRGTVLMEREQPYIDAARALGASSWGTMSRHLLPNIVGPIVVLTTLDMGAILLGISGLSFLGLGVSPPTAEWGSMLSEGRPYMLQDFNLMLIPGLAIFLLVLGFNLLGDGLRDALDPRSPWHTGR